MSIKGFDFYAERPIMSHFYYKKKAGYKLGAENLTYGVVKTLWADELVCDKDIAELFELSVQEIRSLREKYSINHSTVVGEYAKRAYSVLGNLGASIMLA